MNGSPKTPEAARYTFGQILQQEKQQSGCHIWNRSTISERSQEILAKAASWYSATTVTPVEHVGDDHEVLDAPAHRAA